jgi:hypothetical protein
MPCSYEGCDQEQISGERQCIFHVDKQNWYDDLSDSSSLKSSYESRLNTFWNSLRDLPNQGNTSLSGFIFPHRSNNDEEKLITSFTNTHGSEFDLSYAKFLFDIEFSNIDNEQVYKFNNATFYGKVVFRDSSFRGWISLEKADFQSRADFKDISFHHKVYFDKATFQSSVQYKEISFHKKVSFHKSAFKEVHFRDIFVDEDFYFSPTKIDALRLNDVFLHPKSINEFHDFKIQSIVINRFFNYSESMKFTNIEVKSKITIIDACLTRVEITELDISKAKKVIKGSSFAEAILNNVQWGAINEIETDRDHFRQLKVALEKQGDHIGSNLFYCQEMREYKKELSDPKLSRDTWQDKIAFTIGDWASEYSTNWWRPIWLYFFISVFFFSPYIYFDFPMTNTASEFSNFINPLKSFGQDEYSNVGTWYLAYKLISAFLIYHFVVALRRQTKR